MTLDQQETFAQQLERAAEIMRSTASDETKINTMTRVAGISAHHAKVWGDQKFDQFIDNLDSKTV